MDPEIVSVEEKSKLDQKQFFSAVNNQIILMVRKSTSSHLLRIPYDTENYLAAAKKVCKLSTLLNCCCLIMIELNHSINQSKITV